MTFELDLYRGLAALLALALGITLLIPGLTVWLSNLLRAHAAAMRALYPALLAAVQAYRDGWRECRRVEAQ